MRKILLLALLAITLPAAAQNIIRYHYGDNPAWADPAFDDRGWVTDSDGRFPRPPFDSSGYIWIRAAVVPRSTEPLASTIEGLESRWTASAWDLFVNGALVRTHGQPDPPFRFQRLPLVPVVPLSPGLVQPGGPATIALRLWIPPGFRDPDIQDQVHFQLDSGRFLQLQSQSEKGKRLLVTGPELAIETLVTLIGIGLLLLWRTTRTSELLLCAGFLLFYAPLAFLDTLQGFGFLTIPSTLWADSYYIIQAMEMAFTVAFLWQIHRLRSRFFGLLCVLALLHFNLCELVLQTDPHASLLVAFANLSWVYSLHIFNFVSIGANLCALCLAGRNRFIAVALALIPAASEIQHAAIKHGHDIQVGIGPLKIDPFNLAFLIASIVLFAVLFRRAWSAWRAREDLRAEFDSAREMQQLLVTPAADLPGFSIQSAYLPARDVGGDFFHVSQQPAGAVLVVIGDVSGKGLRAAMTVSAIMGALRTVPGTQALSPAAILAHLNLGLAGHMGGGFVTACAACLSPQGRLTLANAGHLAPYANGLELPIDSGLPLGILPDTTYAESIADLAPNASLTFLSDGVLEARNAAGELFGFERTSAISTQSAGQIAAAAQAFGQEDDITVLTLQSRLPT
jgi:hypothetical protein